MHAAFRDELRIATHLEVIQRVAGRVTCSGLPVLRYSTAGAASPRSWPTISRGAACSVANPHTCTLEDGAGHKRVGEEQPAMKAAMDPFALLNPGKMRSYQADTKPSATPQDSHA